MKAYTLLLSKRFLLIILSFLFSFNIFANSTEHPLYEEGNIYLKVKNNSSVELGLPNRSSNPEDIESIFVEYEVTEIIKPFQGYKTPQFDRIYKISIEQTEQIGDCINALKELPYIQFVERVPYKIKHQLQPNDSSVPVLSYHLELINAYDAFEIHPGDPLDNGAGSLIAIVDDGFLKTHEDLEDNYIDGWDEAMQDDDVSPDNTDQDHGTIVAGIACGRTNNNKGVASMSWNNSLLAVKATTADAADNTITHGYEGIMWAATNGASIINASWGSYTYSEAEYLCIVQARDQGAIIVNSAGNENSTNPNYPGAFGEGITNEPWEIFDEHLIISVASIDANGNKSSFSNRGQWVDICTYGSNMYSTSATGVSDYIGEQNGTSFSAPLVAGLLGYMKSANPTATNEELINCLLSSANTDIYDSGQNPYGSLGSGRVDALSALLCIAPTCTNPSAYIFSSAPEVCSNETVELTTTQGTDYLWSTGAITQTISITQPGTYSVTITIDNSCTTSTSIDIVECPESSCFCNRTVSYNFGIDDGAVHNFSELPGIPQGQNVSFACITIQGKVRFDLPLFSFFNSDIYLHPGAELIVPNGSYLNLYSCNLQGCSDMWRGLVAESGSELRLRKSVISDAQYAVTAYHNSIIRIQENVFDRNFVGVYVPPNVNQIFQPAIIEQIPSPTTISIPFGPYKGNRFLCTSDLSSPYSGQTPDPGNITFSGLLLYNMNFYEVGFAKYNSWAGNIQQTIFDGLRNGIIAYQTTVEVENTVFRNMVGNNEGGFPFHASAAYDNAGIAILLYNSNGLEIDDSAFENSFIGISTRHSDINGVRDCHFNNVGTGIKVFNEDGQNVFIGEPGGMFDNQIYCREGGILLHNAGRSNVSIQNNDIYRAENSTSPMIGIGVYNSTFDVQGSGNVNGDGGVGDIFDNTVFLSSSNTPNLDIGIEISNSEHVRLDDNGVVESEDIEMSGLNTLLSITGSDHIQVRNNNFVGTVLVESTSIGLDIINSQDNTFCCNSISTGQSANFSGMCNNSKLRGNTFTHPDSRGLFLSTGTVIGHQGSTDNANDPNYDGFLPGNLWIQSNGSPILGAELEDELDREFSKIYIDPDVDFIIPNSVFPTSNWFIPISSPLNLTTVECDVQIDCAVPIVNIVGDPDIKVFDEKIAEENINDIYSGGLLWEGKRYLYEKLNSTSTTTGNLVIDNFYTLSNNSSIGHLYNVDQNINDLYSLNNPHVPIVAEKRAVVTNTLNQIREKNDLFLVEPVENHPTILSEKQDLIQQLGIQNEELNIAKYDYQIFKQSVVDNISNENSAISVTEVFEQNRKSVNDIYLNTFASKVYFFDQPQTDLLTNIANQCPLSGGNAVFQARGMLKFVYGNITFGDTACTSAQYQERKAENGILQSINKLEVFPNPTSGVITLKLTNPTNKNLWIEVFDIAGKLVTSILFPANEHQIGLDMNKLSVESGTYLYKCNIDNQSINGKIILIK